MLNAAVIVWRLLGFLIAALAPLFLPFLGTFAYVKDLPQYQLPQALSAWANFDGLYYLRIAEHSYQQYEQAFFPLFPLLIRLLTPLFQGNELLAGLFIANLALLLGLTVFQKLLKATSPKVATLAPIILLSFPTAFFLGAVYTESLFLLLVVLSLYLLKKGRLGWAGILAYFASLTRLMGIFLVIPLLFQIFSSRSKNPQKFKDYLVLILPPLGLITYMGYLYYSTGDALAFFHSQSVFGEARSTSLILLPQVIFRYLRIFLTADWSVQYFVSLVEFGTFGIVLGVLLLDLRKRVKMNDNFLISLNLFSLINLVLPTFTGSLMSIPRFSLLCLSFFIYLAELNNHVLKGALLLSFAALQVILLTFFIQGYFIS